MIAGLPEARAVEAVTWLDSPAIIRRTIRAELGGLARGAVLAALGHRLERVENMKGKVM